MSKSKAVASASPSQPHSGRLRKGKEEEGQHTAPKWHTSLSLSSVPFTRTEPRDHSGAGKLPAAGWWWARDACILLLKQEGEIPADRMEALSPRPPGTWVFSVVNKHIDLLVCPDAAKSRGSQNRPPLFHGAHGLAGERGWSQS